MSQLFQKNNSYFFRHAMTCVAKAEMYNNEFKQETSTSLARLFTWSFNSSSL